MITSKLKQTIDSLAIEDISRDRKLVLQPLIDYIDQKLNGHDPVKLNFICTHNSRRSQLAQVWAQTAAHFYGISAECFSGGVEETSFNPRAAGALERAGFVINAGQGDNPVYSVAFAEGAQPVKAYSKPYDHPDNPAENFAAVMTCSDADQNCPYIPGTEKRIPVRYDDPKEADGTDEETTVYDRRSRQIAIEMFYVFSKIKTRL